jgi:Derlin-2/3
MENIEQWYKNIPIITKIYLTLSTITSFAVTFEILSTFDLYLNTILVLNYNQVFIKIFNF